MPDDDDIVVVGKRPPLKGDGGSGTGGGGGKSGPGPTTFKPYGDGSKYRIAPDGRLEITPEWKARIDAGETDWWGVAEDTGIIVGAAGGVVLTGPAKYAVGALLYGLKTWSELHGTNKPKK